MKKLLSGALALVLCAALSGCGSTSGDEKSLVIGASITPHAEIIKNIQPDLKRWATRWRSWSSAITTSLMKH